MPLPTDSRRHPDSGRDRMPRTRRTRYAVAAAMVFMLIMPGVAGAMPAPAPRAGPIDCRATATKLGDEITVTFWLRTTRAHRFWTIRIWDNQTRIVSTTRQTNARGDIRVRAATRNQRGRDVFRFRATNSPSASFCSVGDLRV